MARARPDPSRRGATLPEELRPYRKALVNAGLRETLALARDLEGDPRAESPQRLDAVNVLATSSRAAT